MTSVDTGSSRGTEYPIENCPYQDSEFAVSTDREIILIDSRYNKFLGPIRVVNDTGKMKEDVKEKPGSFFVAQQSDRVVQVTYGYTRSIRWLTKSEYALECLHGETVRRLQYIESMLHSQ